KQGGRTRRTESGKETRRTSTSPRGKEGASPRGTASQRTPEGRGASPPRGGKGPRAGRTRRREGTQGDRTRRTKGSQQRGATPKGTPPRSGRAIRARAACPRHPRADRPVRRDGLPARARRRKRPRGIYRASPDDGTGRETSRRVAAATNRRRVVVGRGPQRR